LFTFIPVFFVGHDEKDLPDEISLKYPVLYQQGQLKSSFNVNVFTQWMVRGLIYATMTYYLCTSMLRDRVDQHGIPMTLELVGTITYWVVITQANVELLIRVKNRRPRVVLICLISILAYYPAMNFYTTSFWRGSGNSFSMQGVGASVLSSAVTYQVLAAGVGAYMIMSLFMKRLQTMISPSPIDRIMQAIRTNDDFTIKSQRANIARTVRYKENKEEPTMTTEKQSESDQLRLYKWTLVFKSPTSEQGFRRYMLLRSIRSMQLALLVLAVGCVSQAAYYLAAGRSSMTIFFFGIFSFLIVMWGITKTSFYQTRWDMINSTCLVIVIIGVSAFQVTEKQDGAVGCAFAIVVIVGQSQLPFSMSVPIALFQIVLYSLRLILSDVVQYKKELPECFGLRGEVCLWADYCPWLLSIFFFSAWGTYRAQYYDRFQFKLQGKLRSAMARTKHLLCNMLPAKVVEGILEQGGAGKDIFASECPMISVIFCDIYNFAPLVAGLEPFALVKLLDAVFSTLDRLAAEFAIYKIETVSETYLAVGGIQMGADGDNFMTISDAGSVAKSTVEFAIHILRKMQGIPLDVKDRKPYVEVKIGINSGSAISGIVGAKKPQFVVVGDTVNTAARMKSTNPAADRIHISKSTYSLIEDETCFEWSSRKTMVKGKGEMDTYLLEKYVESEKEQRRRSTAGLAGMADMASGGSKVPDMAKKRSGSIERSITVMARGSSMMLQKKLKKLTTESADGTDDFSMSSSMSSSRKGEESKNSKELAEEAFAGSGETMNALGLNYALNFRDEQAENEFRNEYQSDKAGGMFTAKSSLRMVFLVWLLMYILQTTVAFVVPREPPSDRPRLLGYRCIFMVAAAALLIAFDRYETRTVIAACTAFVSVGGWFAATTPLIVPQDPWELDRSYRFSLEMYTWVTMISCLFGVLYATVVKIMAIFWCLFCVILIVKFSLGKTADWVMQKTLEEFLFSTSFAIITVMASYSMELRARIIHAEVQQYDRIRFEAQRFLADMLPADIFRRMREERLLLAYRYDNMTFMFADICGFTAFSSTHTAAEVVRMLTHLFSVFDKLTTELGIYKVCTIGDAYVACTEPVPDAPKETKVASAERILEFSGMMLQHIRKTAEKLGIETLNMRIGLHNGGFVGGIIGQKTLRYDIWGIDVMVGNSVESGGVPGSVAASEEFKTYAVEEWGTRYSFEPHKDIEVVGRPVKLFLLPQLLEEVSVRIEDYFPEGTETENGAGLPSTGFSGASEPRGRPSQSKKNNNRMTASKVVPS
jgi:class 3 adenylate cyclase